MKTLFRIFLLSLLVLLAACEEELPGAPLPVPNANGYVTCSMELNGGVVAYDGVTRASNGYKWQDGDRLYIRFATEKDTVLGFANYNGANEEWLVNYAGSLNAGATQNCEVYFFENATHKDNSTVQLTALSAIYQDTAAVYCFEANAISLNATLHPKTGRVRFVSQNRDEFSLAGIRYYIGFDLSNKKFDVNYRRRLVLNAHQKQDNGEYSTDYLYGFYEENYDGSVSKEMPLGLDIINHADTSKVYHKDFALEMLNAGNSGYITLPSESVNQGWSVDKFDGGRYFAKWKYRGPDLSAVGGVLLNGNVIFDYDDSWYYCWGDRDSDGDYVTDGEYYTGTGSISKTKYDLAYAWYNDFNGYMPTKAAVSQMLSLNKYSNFCLVSDDFNVLALGNTYGYEDLNSSEDYDVGSKYLWTASAVSSTNAYAVVFTDNGYEIKSMHKKYGMGFLVTFDNELANNDNDYRSYNGINNGYEYVDLGLSSGVKWATFNIGATKPEEFGGYYAWGETEEKEEYSWSTYKWCNGSYNSITKYCTDGSYGTVDNKTTLDPEDDVAHVKWGGDWRMPTFAEMKELLDSCTWTWTTQNGINGYKVTSKSNGNSIFLPAAGYRSGITLYAKNSEGHIWSSLLYTKDGSHYANTLRFFSGISYACNSFNRNFGLSVRPVCGEPAAPVEKYTVTVGSEGGGSVAIKDADGVTVEFEAGVSVTVVATPDEGANFLGWFVSGSDTPVSTAAEYTFTVSQDVALVARFEKDAYLPSGSIGGHDYVDLGLPSGLKWATFNVGATKPEEYGGYYAWGETEEKENYDWSTYKWCNGSGTTMTKYCTDSSYGTVDNKTTLDPEDDVAHVKWGGSWRMPTKEELEELRNHCTWTLTTQNGVNGYKVTGSNGNSIFLPAAGYRLGADVYNRGGRGGCWSSSLDEGDRSRAYGLFFRDGYYDWYCYSLRYYGQSVRPVCGEPAAPVEKYTVTVSSEGGGNVAIKDADGVTVEFEAGVSVTVVATPDEGYVFEGWYVDGSKVSTTVEYTFTVTADIALVAKFEQTVNYNGYEYVDLGLSVKWATCNVGATTPEEYGGYYAWGETEEKENYDWSTYKWCNGSETSMTKYCTDSSYGTVDNKTTLDPEDDVAHVKWGGSWRMPTNAEQDELLNNCTWTWTTQNGVKGRKVTSKTNGNSIFLPAAGCCNGSGVYDRGYSGIYWSSSLYEGRSYNACYLYFNDGGYGWHHYNRYYGLSVRPVSK